MPGYQEIIIISAIVAGVIFLPRILAPPKQTPRLVRPRPRMTGPRRAALAATIAYPLVVAAIMQPWQNGAARYMIIGIGPVIALWLIYWVLQGFSQRR